MRWGLNENREIQTLIEIIYIHLQNFLYKLILVESTYTMATNFRERRGHDAGDRYRPRRYFSMPSTSHLKVQLH